jgi:class 3 adenylate cyclase
MRDAPRGSRPGGANYIIIVVTEATVSRQALIEAIAALESKKDPAGQDRELDRVVQTALQALRLKLADISAQPDLDQHPELAVLVADLSGFTALSEHMDAENVREALNAMWRVLDKVIGAWGGQIDQHAGDSLLALFGLPRPRRYDAARALQAALAMQLELALFNERSRMVTAVDETYAWARDWPGPLMRIGVHAGPVYFAQAPDSGQRTAVGDTILAGRYLEKRAPPGRVLTSNTVYKAIHPQFLLEVLTDRTDKSPHIDAGWYGETDAYVVLGERSDSRPLPAGLENHPARTLGRTSELDDMQMVMQSIIDSRAPQLITIAGGPGMGKSRLIREFETQMRLSGESLTILHAGTLQVWPALPYSLVRDLILRRLRIRAQHSRYAIDAKLRQALIQIRAEGLGKPPLMTIDKATESLRQLLNVKTASSLDADDVFALVVRLLENITAGGPAVLVLDHVDRADSQSLELVDRLLLVETDLPLLILCTVDHDISEDRLSPIPWLRREADPFSPVLPLGISPLSPVNARLMATEVFGRLSPLPMRLIDLAVAESGGNPMYIEEFSRLLLDMGLITGEETQRVDLARVETMTLPADLGDLIRARLNRLAKQELVLLQQAAVMGLVLWDAILFEPDPENMYGIDHPAINTALFNLESKQYLEPDVIHGFADIQAYKFERGYVRDIVYQMIPEDDRPRLHRRAASWWISVKEDTQSGVWLPVDAMINWHLIRAGEGSRATNW